MLTENVTYERPHHKNSVAPSSPAPQSAPTTKVVYQDRSLGQHSAAVFPILNDEEVWHDAPRKKSPDSFLRASSEACSARLRLILTRFEGEVEVGCGDILWNMSCRGYIKAGTWILEVIRGHQGCLRLSEASSSLGGQWMIIGFRKICPIQPFRGQRINFLLVSISKTGKY